MSFDKYFLNDVHSNMIPHCSKVWGQQDFYTYIQQGHIELIRSDIYNIYSVIEDRKLHAKQKIRQVKDLTALLKAPENLNSVIY